MSRPIKRSSGCKSFFVFLLGMITGVVVFLGSIAGTIYVVVSSYSIRDIENTFNVDVPLGENEIMDTKLLDLGKDLYNTIMNISSMTVQDLIDKYGLPLPADLYGIDVSTLYSYSISEIPNHFQELFDSVSLSTIGNLTGMDFSSYNLPVLTRNLDKPVTEAFDEILGSFSGEMSMRLLSTNFGIDLAGSSDMLSLFTDIPLDSLGGAIDYLNLGDLVDIDTDLYIETGATTLYVQTNRFEEISDPAVEVEGSLRYISDTTETGLVYKEMRYIQNEDETFSVNNEEPDAETTYYRFYEYEAYDPLIQTDATDFYVKGYADKFELSGVDYEPIETDFFRLNDLFADDLGTPISDYSTLTSGETFYIFDETTSTYIAIDECGIDGIATENSSFDTEFNGWLLAHEGESDAPMQVIAFSTINTLNNVTDDILRLPLGDLIDIDTSETSTDPKIMQTLSTSPISELSATVGTLTLSDAIDIDTSPESTDAKILQSLAGAVITNLSDEVNALSLGDAINIDENSHIVLQRLKDVGINDVGTQMTVVIDQLVLKELIDIQQYSVYSTTVSSSDILLTRFGDTATYLYTIDNEGNYYFDGAQFTTLDATYLASPGDYSKYSKHFFEEMLVHNDLGNYVLINGFATIYDSEDATQIGLEHFDLVNGYIATSGEIVNDANGLNYVLNESENSVVEDATPNYVVTDVNYTKSSKMLVSLGNVSVENMGTSFSSMTMGQIVTIEADSFFDDDGIRNATPDNLAGAIGTRLANSTIGQLVDWGNLSLNSTVSTMLQNVTVADFFSHLQYDIGSGNIIYVP